MMLWKSAEGVEGSRSFSLEVVDNCKLSQARLPLQDPVLQMMPMYGQRAPCSMLVCLREYSTTTCRSLNDSFSDERRLFAQTAPSDLLNLLGSSCANNKEV